MKGGLNEWHYEGKQSVQSLSVMKLKGSKRWVASAGTSLISDFWMDSLADGYRVFSRKSWWNHKLGHRELQQLWIVVKFWLSHWFWQRNFRGKTRFAGGQWINTCLSGAWREIRLQVEYRRSSLQSRSSGWRVGSYGNSRHKSHAAISQIEKSQNAEKRCFRDFLTNFGFSDLLALFMLTSWWRGFCRIAGTDDDVGTDVAVTWRDDQADA